MQLNSAEYKALPKDFRVKVKKAIRHRHITCPHQRINRSVAQATATATAGREDSPGGTPSMKTRYREYSPWKFKLPNFGRFGLGVLLYFKFLRDLSVGFCFLAVLALPALVINLHGEYAVSTYGLEKTTLGNLGTALNQSTVFIPFVGTESKVVAKWTMSLLDIASCLVFLCIVVSMRKFRQRASEKYEAQFLSIRLYSVQVTHLPEKVIDRKHLAAFFQEVYGPIADVAIVYNDAAIIALYAERGELRKKLVALETRQARPGQLNSMRAKIDKVDRKIGMAKHRMGAAIPVCAFITFQYQESARRCIRDYPDSFVSRWTMPQHMRYNKASIRVLPAPEPSNVIYENLRYNRCDKCLGRFAVTLVSFLILCVSFTIAYFALSYQRDLPRDGTSCPSSGVTAEQAQYDSDMLACYCRGLGTDMLDDPNVDCLDFLKTFALTKTLVGLTTLTIVLVNLLLRVIFRRIVRWEKHYSLTREQNAVATKLFYGLFVNTGIVLLFVHASFSGGAYEDFQPAWYEMVGVPILLTMMVSVFSPHIFPLARAYMGRCQRRNCLRRDATETELKAIFEGEQFELAERHAIILNVVFVAFFYTAGMPLLTFLAFASLSCMYWFDKISFFRFYRLPPRYDDSLSLGMLDLLPFAVMTRLAMAVWLYTSPTLEQENNTSASNASLGGAYLVHVPNRVLASHVLPLFGMLALMVAHNMVAYSIKYCTCGYRPCRKNRRLAKVLPEVHVIPFSDACCRIQMKSYRVHEHRDYRSAFLHTKSMKQLRPEPPLVRWPSTKGINFKQTLDRNSSLMPEQADDTWNPDRKAGQQAFQPFVMREEDRLAAALDNVVTVQDLEADDPYNRRGSVAMPKLSIPVVQQSPHQQSHQPRDSISRALGNVDESWMQAATVSYARHQQVHSRAPESPTFVASPHHNAWQQSGEADAQEEPGAIAVVEVACPVPQCRALIRLVDTGEESEYSCPFCKQAFIM
jgi:Cytosolic domain of 10TM putative phosphate transporter